MKKSNIVFSPFLLDKISNTNELKNVEKINFLQYVGYMTESEKKELMKTL